MGYWCTATLIEQAMFKRFERRGELAFEVTIRLQDDPRRNRRIDAVHIGGWLHDHSLEAFEFKASRNDWLKELADPSKQSEAKRVCDSLTLIAPRDIIRDSEIPAEFGFWSVDRNGELRTEKHSPIFNRETLTRADLVALAKGVAVAEERRILHRMGGDSGRFIDAATDE